MAPVNAEIITNSGMKPRIVAARCCELETSTSSICTRRRDRGADAARDQSQAADLAVVALQQPAHPLHLRPRVLAGAVGDQANLRGLGGAEVFREVRRE